ncbi:MAG: endo-1,4-beta-xylanase [Candidatus Jorgensenbacteria bacterium]
MKRLWKFSLIVLGVLFALYGASWLLDFDRGGQVWGLTFSQYYASEELGLDWKQAYEAALGELQPKRVRLIAYWQYLEPSRGEFHFDDLDWQIEEAAKHGATVTLAVGHRVPRWPECHWPSWVRYETIKQFPADVERYLTAVVEHFRDSPTVTRWQVENEPFFPFFGVCPPADRALLERELSLVKQLDPSRPIMVTDSGELSTWRKVAGLSDVLGTTLYRVAWNQYLGWWKHYLPPSFYTLRAWLATHLSQTREVIVAELQAEPWASENRSIVTVPFGEQTSHFDLRDMESMFAFARRTGLREIYLWGAEWWYWRKLHGDPSFWDAARDIMR